jgi:energy-coupling factor transporter ATP-binding protein EcfA2
MRHFKLPSDISSSIKNIESVYSSTQGISPKYLLSYMYGVGCHIKNYKDTFNSEEVLNKLNKEGEIVEVSETLNSKSNSNNEETPRDYYISEEFIESDKTFCYFYKDNVIRVSIFEEEGFASRKKENCSLTFFFPITKECADVEFLKFITNTHDPKVFLLNQEYGDFVFSKFSVSLPQTFDLELNYGKDFISVNEKIIKSLNENHSGLYMLHGPPGTGKSTYIKYLASVLKKDVIFFPTSLVGDLTNPSIVNLLTKKQNCVLILEDAEKAIMKREHNLDSSLVSTLLNMTDGILGDVLKLNVIVTYNCKRHEIDEALLRKGRLKAEHSFDKLSIENVKKLVKKLKLNFSVQEDMTLADIFNYKNDDELIGNRASLIERPAIGFGAASS